VEGTYPDAFEYAKDPRDNKAVTVESWDMLKGAHKKTGVKADMILHRSFELTKDNKIRRLLNYINPEVANEIGRGYAERTNGTIYNQHESINKLRLMMAAAEHGDSDKKVIKFPMHYQHDVDKEGKIVNTISYYSAALLN